MPETAPTPADLLKQAQQETDLAVGNEIAPLNRDVGRAEAGMANALSGVDKMFGNLLPYVQSSAQRVGDFYNQGLAEEKGVWATANARLGQIRSQRAAEAQALAQQIGGPVPVEAFLAPLNTSLSEMPHAQAGGLLRSMALAQGGVQEAEAFAGRVFPLLRTEQETQIRQQFQQRINELQDEIARVRSTSTERTQTRLDQLTQQERQYKLEQAQLALDRLKADRDWRLSQQEMAQRRVQLANDKANLLGYYDKPWRDKQGRLHTSRVYTLSGRQLQETIRANQAGEGQAALAERHDFLISQQELQQRKMEAAAAARQNAQGVAQQQRENASKYMDAAMSQGTDTVTYDQPVHITAEQAAGMSKENLYPDGQGGYYKVVKITERVKTPIISNPTEMYNFLVGHAIPKAVALQSVRNRFGLPSTWDPGERFSPGKLAAKTIESMNFEELRKAARARGWKPNPNRPFTRNDFIRWLERFEGVQPASVGATVPVGPNSDYPGL